MVDSDNVISHVHTQTGNVLAPNDRPFVAGISQAIRVVVRTVPNLAVHAVFTAVDKIDRIEWSPNGSLVMAVIATQGIVQIWSIDDPDWNCRIDTGLTGLKNAHFHPISSAHVLVYSEFGLRVDIWNIVTEAKCHVKDVNENVPLVVSHSGRYALLLGRQSIHVIDLSPPEDDELSSAILHSVSLKGTKEIAGLAWTSQDDGIIAYESPLTPTLYVFSLDGSRCHTTHLYGDTASSHGVQLGVRSVTQTRSIFFVGCYDDSVRIFSTKKASLNLLAVLELGDPIVNVVDDYPIVLRESLGGNATLRERNMYHLGGGDVGNHPVEYIEVSRDLSSVQLPSVENMNPLSHVQGKKTTVIGPPRGGISALRVSPDGAWLAVQSDKNSAVVFLIEIARLRVMCILVHRQPVRHFVWNPSGVASRNQLAITTGEARLFIWTPTMDNSTVNLADSTFKLLKIDWTRGGDSIILADRDKVCSLSHSVARGL